MSSITIDIKDIKKLEKILANLDSKVKDDLDSKVNGVALDTQRLAAQSAPEDIGRLAGSFSTEKEKNKELSYVIKNNMPYAPYVEFGTGGKYKPGEWDDFAKQFQGKGDGTFDEGVQAIADWLGRHGGNPEDAVGVLFSILKNGISPQPFLWPAFKLGRKQLEQDVTDYINNFGLDE